MTVNLSEAVEAIKRAGAVNVRTVPMAGESVHGDKYQIEVKDPVWKPIIQGITQSAAEDIIRQATNRVICG